MKYSIMVFLLAASMARAANTVTLIPDLVSGNGSVAVTLTWSTSPAATSCIASGAWVGARGAAGTQLQSAITKSATYVLSCSWNTGDAVVTWMAPTQNTDGSVLTDLAGFKLYKQVGAGAFSLLTTINSPATLSFTDAPLQPATYGYQMTAFNSGGIESDRTTTATKTVVAGTATQQIAITVNPKPNAPIGLAVN